MTEPLDPLLRALGEVERGHERAHPEVWEDVLAGRVTPEEAAARASADPDAPPADLLKELFAGPISEREVAGLVDRAIAAQPRPVVITGRWRRPAAVAAVVLALAAALLLLLLPPGRPARGEMVAYDVTVRSRGVQAQRSDATAAMVEVYRVDSTIDVVLSPTRPTPEAVALWLLARDADGREVVVTPEFTRTSAGALQVKGRVDAALRLGPGRWLLRFIVAAPGVEIDGPDAAARALTDGTASEPSRRLELEIQAAD